MRHGDKEAWLRQVEAETGQSFRVLREKPDLPWALRKYWEAFFLLQSDRTVTALGMGAIPLSAVESYTRLFRIAAMDEVEEYVYFIRLLDREYLKDRDENHDGTPTDGDCRRD